MELEGLWLVMLLAGLARADGERTSEGRVLAVALEDR